MLVYVQGHIDLAGLHTANRGVKTVSSVLVAVYKIAGSSVLPRITPGVQAVCCLPCQQFSRPACLVLQSSFSQQIRQKSVSTAAKVLLQRPQLAAHGMAGLKQSVAVRQPAAVLEQEVSTAEVPLTLATPAKKEKAHKQSQASKSDTDALLASNGCADTLADRIKAGTGRRRLTQFKTHIPSAAVNSLAESVDRIIAPETGATERFMDSRDADSNIPRDIPGASLEQQQHAAMQSSNEAAGQGLVAGAHEQAGTETAGKSKKKRKEGKGHKSDLLQTASQLAQGSNSTQDILKEDDKVCTRVCLCNAACSSYLLSKHKAVIHVLYVVRVQSLSPRLSAVQVNSVTACADKTRTPLCLLVAEVCHNTCA